MGKEKKEHWFGAIITAIGFCIVLGVLFFGAAMICGLFLKIVLDIAFN